MIPKRNTDHKHKESLEKALNNKTRVIDNIPNIIIIRLTNKHNKHTTNTNTNTNPNTSRNTNTRTNIANNGKSNGNNNKVNNTNHNKQKQITITTPVTVIMIT